MSGLKPNELENYERQLAMDTKAKRASGHRRAARGDFDAERRYLRLGRPSEARASHVSGVENLKTARRLEGRR